MRHGQRGMTFIGLLCIVVLVGVIGYAGLRLVPVFLNYMKIVRTMESVAAEFKGDNPDPGKIRNSLDRHFTIEDIGEIDVKNIEIKKDNDVVTLHVAYEHTVPYAGNISLTASFDKTVKVE
jgi:hypothetical protein